jgi:hypothetical protein
MKEKIISISVLLAIVVGCSLNNPFLSSDLKSNANPMKPATGELPQRAVFRFRNGDKQADQHHKLALSTALIGKRDTELSMLQAE